MYNESDFKYIITPKSISISYQDLSQIILSDSPSFEEVKKAIERKDWGQVLALMSPGSMVETLSSGEMYVNGDQVYLKCEDGTSWEVPKDLNNFILDCLKNGNAFQYLVTFSNKLRKNPSKNSVDQLFTFLVRNKFVLTQNGNFIAYKRVRKDFLDIYTGTMDNSVGKVVEMDRGSVNSNPEQTCSYGLHVANYYYASSCYSKAPDDILLLVEVNPADVVSVPTDYNFSKMRVCRYKVLKVCSEEFVEQVYQDSDWE